MANIKLQDVSLEIVNAASLYTEEIKTEIIDTLNNLGNQALIEVKVATPVSDRIYRNKNGVPLAHLRDYFAVKIVNQPTEVRFEIYARKKYNIIHFLEFGTSKMAPQPFIRPTELKYKGIFYRQLENIVNKDKKV